jgi:hypothetical protein
MLPIMNNVHESFTVARVVFSSYQNGMDGLLRKIALARRARARRFRERKMSAGDEAAPPSHMSRASRAYADGYTAAFQGLRAEDDMRRPDIDGATSAYEAYVAARDRDEYNRGYLEGDAARRGEV